MAIFKGAGVAIATPMKENLEINFDKLDDPLCCGTRQPPYSGYCRNWF